MLKKLYIALLLSIVCIANAFGANPVTVTFSDTPLPSALKTIEQLAGDDITINFSFRKLEDYTVTTEIIDASPLEAIIQTIGFYPIKVTSKGAVLTVQPTVDTDYKVSGRLVDQYGEGVDYASIIVLSLPDSTVITSGVSNLRGDFVIPVQGPKPMALKASRIGYKTTTATVSLGNNGDIQIPADPHVLKTLTAYGDRKIITTAGAVTNIHIEGTPYSQIGTFAELLPNLPGMMISPASFGANGAVYYLNGREVSEMTQLNMLRTDEIKDISIDKAPSAEYPADATMVVKITTVRSPNDFINLQVSNTTQARNKLSDIPNVDFKMQLGKFTTALNLQYDYLKAKTQTGYYRSLDGPQNKIWLLSQRDVYSMDKGLRLNWSGELQLNPRSRLGLYYYFYSINGDGDQKGQTQSLAHGMYDVSAYEHRNNPLHSGTVSYDYTGKRFSVHLAQDVAYSTPDFYRGVREDKGDERTSRFEDVSHEYLVTTSNARLGWKLTPKTLINIGGRLSYIESNTGKYFMGDPFTVAYEEVDGSYNGYYKHNHMSVNETTAQGYLSLSQRLGNVLITPGIRYEYNDRWISDDATIIEDIFSSMAPQQAQEIHNIYDKKFSRWLPSLNVKYSVGDFTSSLNYMSHMVQPTFSMLNSGILYEDNFTYYKSNPVLKPTDIYDLRLSLGYRGLSADIGYKRIRNGIAEIEEPIDDSGAVYRTPINLRKYHEVDVNLGYTSQIGRLGYYGAAQLVIPGWNTVHYSDQKVTFNAELNLSYTFNRHFSLYTNFKHLGSCRWMVFDRIDSQLWNLGANASLFGNRLNINLEASDLLGRNHIEHISTVYNNITSTHSVDLDTRGVRLRIAYTLFNKPIRTNVHRGNIDDISRIEK